MWVIDIRHWLDNTKTGPATPQLKFKVKKLSEIITYATAEAAGIPLKIHPNAGERPKGSHVPAIWISAWMSPLSRYTGNVMPVMMREL